MKPFQEKLVAAWRDYVAGKIDAAALKGVSAGFGIYQQRDGATMMRIRRPAGIMTVGDFRAVAALLDRFGAPFCHLTTRLDVQLHGVKATDVPQALAACEEAGFAFRGGGGDTFRNVQVNPCSGLHEDTEFDVVPYVRAISEAFYGFDVAYGLPRKIKIGLVDRPADRQLAAVQDLGFVARMENGHRTFEVWVGGGIGFRPRTGFRLFEALPAEDCCRLAFALTRLFNERGCRTNRSHARIRFLREDMGDERFAAEIREFFKRETNAPLLSMDGEGAAGTLPLHGEVWPLTHFAEDVEAAEGFGQWRQLAVSPLRDGLFAVRLFVPHGNVTASQISRLCDAMEANGVAKVQLLPSEDICIHNVPEAQLKALHRLLVTELGDVDYTVRSFCGHVLTCVGNGICKSGANDSPKFGDAIAAAFDRYLPADTPERLAIAKSVLNDVRVSGCPNSCTNGPMAKFGFVCRRMEGRMAVMPIVGAEREPVRLGELQRDAILCEDVPAWMGARL